MACLPTRRSVLQGIAACGLLALAPAQARTQSLNIFFDFESAELSGAAMELADTIAGEIMPGGRVLLIGHADTAEAQPERISYTRGNAVLTHFLRKQVLSKVRFDVVTGGTSSPLVRTGPNTREARNRRVEIVLG
ncbi:MAG: OmpA family protein [Xanthobacteraceae bacterium]